MRQSRQRRLAAAIAGLSMFVLAACGGGGEEGDSDETFELTIAAFLPDADQPQIDLMKWWADEVEKRSDGRLTFEIHPGGSLLPIGEMLAGTGDGRTDIGHIAAFYSPQQLPLTTITELPFLALDGVAQAQALNEVYDNFEPFRAEYENNNVHVLFFVPATPTVLGSKEPIDSFADLDGMSVRAVGQAGKALEAFGANVVPVEAPELYEGLERGLVDGYTGVGFEFIAGWSYHEAAKYIYDPHFGNYTTPVYTINLDVWNNLPEELQEIMTEVGREVPTHGIEVYTQAFDTLCDQMVEDGAVVASMERDAQYEDVRESASRSIREDWNSTMDAAGVPGDDFAELYLDTLEKFENESDFPSAMERCQARQ